MSRDWSLSYEAEAAQKFRKEEFNRRFEEILDSIRWLADHSPWEHLNEQWALERHREGMEQHARVKALDADDEVPYVDDSRLTPAELWEKIKAYFRKPEVKVA